MLNILYKGYPIYSVRLRSIAAGPGSGAFSPLDPYPGCFFGIPDPVFWIRIHLIRIRIKHFRLNTDPDPGFDDQKFKKIYSWKKTTIYLSPGLHKWCPSYRRSLQLSKENIKPFKTWNFSIFLLLWVIFALLDPDPIRIRNYARIQSIFYENQV